MIFLLHITKDESKCSERYQQKYFRASMINIGLAVDALLDDLKDVISHREFPLS